MAEFKRAWLASETFVQTGDWPKPRRRRNIPWLYRRTRLFGFTPYRIVKWGLPLGLLLFFSISHRLNNTNFIPAPVIISGQISVVDGDTVRSSGYTYRLVGFDTPEKGTLARCKSERILAEMATQRLEQLLHSTLVELQRVPCSCRQDTEETRECNYGRRCAILKVDGQDVGPILIREGLAHSYVCSDTHCPRRRSWCS